MKQPFQEFKTYKMTKEKNGEIKEIAKPLTIEERIELFKQEGAKASQQINEWNAVFLKTQGAIEALEQMSQQMSKK